MAARTRHRWRRALALVFAVTLGFAVALGCGARSGLVVDLVDAGVDGSLAQTPGDGRSCLIAPADTRPAALDIVLLQDASASMTDSAGGFVKFELMAAALEGFMQAERSTGIELSLSFFPMQGPFPATFCESSADCGGIARCIPRVCRFDGRLCDPDDPTQCTRTGGHHFAADCREIGRCSHSGLRCEVGVLGAGCGSGEECEPASVCEAPAECQATGYGEAMVDFGRLPEAGPAVVNAIRGLQYQGATPMAPALGGGLEQARARRVSHPGAKVVVLVATDGFPTCGPAESAVRRVADVARRGLEDGIDTYVVGVFRTNRAEEATENLSRIAAAGGSAQAIVVAVDRAAVDELTDVFARVRERARSCAFDIPSDVRAVLDPNDLEVRLFDIEGGRTRLARRPSRDGCEQYLGYYLEEPANPDVPPGFIELCPAACELVREASARVELEAGCR